MTLSPGPSQRSGAHRRIAAAAAAILAVGVGLTPMAASAQPAAVDRSVSEPVATAPLAARSTSFALKAPESVKTGKRFTIAGSLPRLFANAAALLEVRVDGAWVPIRAAKVSRKGRVSIKAQLSEPGRHAVRVRVGTGRSAAISKVVTINAKGKAVTSESPARMLAHYYAQQDASAPLGRSARADGAGASGSAVAAESASDVISVKSLATDAVVGGVGAVAGFGVDWILGLIFPGSSTATGKQIAGLESEIQNGFNNVYADLAQLQASLDAIQAQNSEIFAETALAACNASLSGLQGDVQVVQDAFSNYRDVLTKDWGEDNLTYAGGTSNAVTIGNYVFGVGSNATPPFGPGVNRVEVAVADLLAAFTQAGPGNVIDTCADAIAGYVIQQEAGSASGPTGQVPIGVLDEAYAELMQNLVGEYAAIINIGIALVGTGDLLAATTVIPSTLSDSQPTLPQFLAACQSIDLFSCPTTALQITQGQAGVTQMWHAAGASWAQVTNKALKSDLYAYSGQTTFSNGDNAWLADITAFQQGTFGLDLTPQSPLTSANVDTSSPVAGVTGFADATWGPLAFSPASSAAYNGLIRTNQYSQPYPGAQGGILEACGGPDLTNCSDSTQVGTYLGWAGLDNGGVAVSADNNLILYTGEDYYWDPAYSSASAGFGFMGKEEGLAWSKDSPNGFQLLVASFIDTGMWPNLGVSAVVNDPATYDFQTGQGTIGNLTLGDVFPFSTNANVNPQYEGKAVATSLTMQNYSGGFNLVAIPCSNWSTSQYQQIGGNWTVMSWLAPGNGNTNSYGDGCGQTRYFPNGGPPSTSYNTTQLTASTTALPGFYTQPQLNAVMVGSGTQPTNYVELCTTPVTAGPACQSNYWNGWQSLPGFVTAIASESDLNDWTPVTPQDQTQYLWPVIPTNATDLAAACPAIPGAPSNITNFSQGISDVGIPQTCLQLFDEWLTMTAGQNIGPVSIQIGTKTGLPGGAYSATVSFTNDDTAPVTVSAGFSGFAGATVAAGPTGDNGIVSSCTQTSDLGNGTFVCQLNLPASSTKDIEVPLNFATGNTSGELVVTASATAQHYLAGASAQVTTAPAPNAGTPFGVTGLSAAFDQSTLNATTGGGSVTLTWNAPYPASLIKAYVVTGTGPSGSTPIDETLSTDDSNASQLIVQSNGQLQTTVDISQGGPWTFTVAAASSAGVGLPDTLNTYLGQAPPEPPRNVKGRELVNGQVALAWQPGMASPPISSYTVTWWSGTSTTPPASASSLTPGPEWVSTGAGSSMVGTVAVTDTNYFVPTLPTTGPWTFQVTATNTMGTSAPSTTMVNMHGFVPSRPVALGVNVLPTGTVNADWSASPFGVPAPTSYTVGLYAPTTCTQDDTCTTPLLASQTLDAPPSRGPSAVFDLFSLGTNSAPGVYTVAVYGTNALGDGATTRSTILITNAFIKRLSTVQDAVDTSKAKISKSIEDLNTLECKRGLLSGSACKS